MLKTDKFEVEEYVEGLSIRDYFAGQALVGLCSEDTDKFEDRVENIAMASYLIADAMIAEKNKSERSK